MNQKIKNKFDAIFLQFPAKYWAFSLIVVGIIILLWYGFKGSFFERGTLDVDKALKFSPFVAGVIGPMFTLAAALLVYENFRYQYRQQIANNFFQLMNLHNNILASIKTEVFDMNSESNSEGRALFDDLAYRIAIDFNETIVSETKFSYDKETNAVKEVERQISPIPIQDKDGNKKIFKDDAEKLKFIFEYYYYAHYSDLDHYYRNLYNIVKYIDEINIPTSEKKRYMKILRSQLSNYEILLLAYSCLTTRGEKFLPFIIKYKLIHNLNLEDNGIEYGWNKRIISNIKILTDFYDQLNKKEIAKKTKWFSKKN